MIDKDEQRMTELGAKLTSNKQKTATEESKKAAQRLAKMAKDIASAWVDANAFRGGEISRGLSDFSGGRKKTVHHGFAVAHGRDRFKWLVDVATFEGGQIFLHDLSGFAGKRRPSRAAIFIPAKDVSKPLCEEASKTAQELCDHLNSIRARASNEQK